MGELDNFTVDVTGLKELNERLDGLTAKVQRQVLRSGLRAGAKVVQKEAARNIAVRSGLTKKHIITKVSVKRAGYGEATVGVKRPRAHIGRFLENGTARMAARPFLRPALDTKAREATRIFGEALDAAVTRQEAKLAAMEAMAAGDE